MYRRKWASKKKTEKLGGKGKLTDLLMKDLTIYYDLALYYDSKEFVFCRKNEEGNMDYVLS